MVKMVSIDLLLCWHEQDFVNALIKVVGFVGLAIIAGSSGKDCHMVMQTCFCDLSLF